MLWTLTAGFLWKCKQIQTRFLNVNLYSVMLIYTLETQWTWRIQSLILRHKKPRNVMATADIWTLNNCLRQINLNVNINVLPTAYPPTHHPTCLPAYQVSMQQSFSRSYQLLTHSRKSCILQNLVHNNVQNSLPLIHIQSQINAVHAYVRSISILCSHLHLGLPCSLFPLVSPSKPVYISLLLPICAACPTYLILLNFITWITLDDEHKSWSTSSYNFL